MAFSTGDENSDGGINEINITPFVDVVLVLLVIFMVTAPMMVKQVLNIQLPSSESADTTESETLGLAITAKGQFLINGKIATEKAVFERAVLAIKKDKNAQVIIAADSESLHRYVVKAIDVVKRAGVENLAFQVSTKKEEDQGNKEMEKE
jgi:biopolymer transport protein ExbD